MNRRYVSASLAVFCFFLAFARPATAIEAWKLDKSHGFDGILKRYPFFQDQSDKRPTAPPKEVPKEAPRQVAPAFRDAVKEKIADLVSDDAGKRTLAKATLIGLAESKNFQSVADVAKVIMDEYTAAKGNDALQKAIAEVAWGIRRPVIPFDEVRKRLASQVTKGKMTTDLSRDVSDLLLAIADNAKAINKFNPPMGKFRAEIVRLLQEAAKKKGEALTEKERAAVIVENKKGLEKLIADRTEAMADQLLLLNKVLPDAGYPITRRFPIRAGKDGPLEAISIHVKGRNGAFALEISDGGMRFYRVDGKTGAPQAMTIQPSAVHPYQRDFPPDIADGIKGKEIDVDRHAFKTHNVVPVLWASGADAAHLDVLATPTTPPPSGLPWMGVNAVSPLQIVEYEYIRRQGDAGGYWSNPAPTRMTVPELVDFHRIQLGGAP